MKSILRIILNISEKKTEEILNRSNSDNENHRTVLKNELGEYEYKLKKHYRCY